MSERLEHKSYKNENGDWQCECCRSLPYPRECVARLREEVDRLLAGYKNMHAAKEAALAERDRLRAFVREFIDTDFGPGHDIQLDDLTHRAIMLLRGVSP